jgi:hypothetical protein
MRAQPDTLFSFRWIVTHTTKTWPGCKTAPYAVEPRSCDAILHVFFRVVADEFGLPVSHGQRNGVIPRLLRWHS